MKTQRIRRKQRIPQIRTPRMTASEKAMWKGYAQLLKAKAPQAALNAWARKYNVKLKRRSRVQFERQYKAPVTSAREEPPVRAPASCAERCKVTKFGGGVAGGEYTCELTGCEYDRDLKAWVCYYTCQWVVRAPQ